MTFKTADEKRAGIILHFCFSLFNFTFSGKLVTFFILFWTRKKLKQNLSPTSTVFLSIVLRTDSLAERCWKTSSSITPSSTVLTVSNADEMRFCVITSKSLTPARNLQKTIIVTEWNFWLPNNNCLFFWCNVFDDAKKIRDWLLYRKSLKKANRDKENHSSVQFSFAFLKIKAFQKVITLINMILFIKKLRKKN